MKLVKVLIVLFTVVASVVLVGVVLPETPVLGPAVRALRDGNAGRALAVVAPSLAPKTTYWTYVDSRGSLRIVTSLDEVPADLRDRAKSMEVESTPLPTAAGGVDARAAASSAAQAARATTKSKSGSDGGGLTRSTGTH